ncbi:MAG: metallophosphoesterase [Bdellovibrionales bacterium]
MKILMFSDTHGHHNVLRINPCDLLIFAGDSTAQNTRPSHYDFHMWLNNQPAKHIICILGNHDDQGKAAYNVWKRRLHDEFPRIHFVRHGPLEIGGVKIFCISSGVKRDKLTSPMSGSPRYDFLWKQIPDDTEILILHEPPSGILNNPGYEPGDTYFRELREKIAAMPQLKLCVFGHAHESSGEMDIEGVHFVNASICNEFNFPDNPVREFDFPCRTAAQRPVPQEQKLVI